MNSHRFLLFCCFFFGLTFMCQGQKPCATPSGKSEWLKAYQANPIAYRGSDTLLWVPLTMHIVGFDNGSGYYADDKVYDELCKLNADFEPSNIQFYLKEDFRYIKDTEFNEHNNLIRGSEIMLDYNVDNTLNCYIMDNAGGACGYGLTFLGALALNENCIGGNDHTFAHEVGHVLSLPHLFLGWEGGVRHDNSVDPDYTAPAPEYVYFNGAFRIEGLGIDTFVLDSVMVEKVDRSNCSEAGDGFCDTPSDYLNFRWRCNFGDESDRTQIDPDGIEFRSDGTYFMSYSLDDCQNQFSIEQAQAMRANLLGPKLDWLYQDSPQAAVTETTTLRYPIEEEEVQFDAIEMSWDAVPNATQYRIRLYLVIGSAVNYWDDFIVFDTTTTIELPINRTFAWEVAAFSNSTFCIEFSEQATFQTGQLTAVHELAELGSYEIFPTIISNQRVHINVQSNKNSELLISLYDLSGQQLQVKQYQQFRGEQLFQLDIPALSAGMYFLKIEADGQQLVERLLIQ